jgi:membrane associated rhomboid family serine protease
LNVFHLIFNLLALTPMVERFENEYGTLTSLALFMGREFCCSSSVLQAALAAS